MSQAPTELGDLIRVVHALRPDRDALALVRELLSEGDPDAPDTGIAVVVADDHEPGGRVELPEPSGRRVSAPPNLGSARATPPRRPASFLSTQARWERAWWTVVVALVVVLLGLRVTGRIGGVAWFVLAVVLVTIRPALINLSSWRQSAQHHSMARHEGRQGGADDQVERVPLERARWQAPPERPPLGRVGQQRAVATLLAGRSVPGPIDLPTMVGRIAARQPLTSVPRHRRWSTTMGIQLQVDRRPALEPFGGDIAQLRRDLAAVASRLAVDEVGFEGDPRHITWPRRLVGPVPGSTVRLAARLPAPGTPVLVVTDLGIAVPRLGTVCDPEHFLEHYGILCRAGADVHYLVPYPPHRWPRVADALPILYWSDRLGPSDVLACIRRRRRSA